jgi:hypothetical protein
MSILRYKVTSVGYEFAVSLISLRRGALCYRAGACEAAKSCLEELREMKEGEY